MSFLQKSAVLQKNVILIVSASAFCLTILKLIFALISGSVVILASAIDSLLDMFVSLFNHFTYKKAQSPSTASFNYGFGKLEGMAGIVESALICGSGVYIIYQSIQKFIANESIKSIESGIFIMLISICATFGIVSFLKIVSKNNHSIIIKSEILHYKTDLFSNIAVILSLILVYMTGIGAIDCLVGAILGIYICTQSYKIAREGFLILLDRAIDDKTHDKIIAILESHKGKAISSYHNLKSRQSGKNIFLEYHLVFNKEISLFNAHEISDGIEAQIKGIAADFEWIILAHLDPYDDSNDE